MAADSGALERAGRAAFPGFQIAALGTLPSTQDVVRAAARSGADAGLCCMAEAQTAGRGRQQRSWSAPPRSSLLASVLVRADHGALGAIPIAAGLALRAAIEATTAVPTAVKWPNDILASSRKLAGILCEVEPAAPGPGTAVVIGMGVNLRVASFPAGVAGVSLDSLAASPPPAPAVLLAAILPELAARLEILTARGVAGLRDEWTKHAAGLGGLVTATSAAGVVTGIAEGIDDDGALLLRTESGLVRVLAGDVHVGAANPAS